ncbi:MAG: hypothetical protein EOR04_25575 [Mesorhizobium sp.]|uniref:hypothetical protein n=1 Tax=Mesorhizobium sp. TaxID=1871066 RepID=UPI000FE53A9D|nr:hypothetical protein [Mesorhizobium sp.]RWP38938.1 MAG: hypothetical protein EOR04_25575 [Mesorhizobium sp.]
MSNDPQMSFQKAILKIEWANKHIENLDAVCSALIQSNVHQSIIKTQAYGGGYEVHLTPELPFGNEVPLLAGDIVSNLRAALDYCWMGLLRSIESKPAKDTLPIGTTRKDVISRIEKTLVGKAFPEVKGLIGDTIQFHRDFAAGGNRSLCALNDLSNWNKHNLLIFSVRTIRTGVVTLLGSKFIGGTFDEGVIPFLVEGFGSNPDIKHEGDFTLDIVFREMDLVENEPVIPTIRNLAQAAREAVEAFIEAFPAKT